MKLSKQAHAECMTYNLLATHDKDSYVALLCEELSRLQNTCKHYGYKKYPLSTPDRHMIRALRSMPSLNSKQDWARLHAIEIASKYGF